MSTDRVNRRQLIIESAAELFMEQGYNATSVRQIADEVGVTEAALYYHFKSGKRELLEAVFAHHMPNFARILDNCPDVGSLAELVQCFGLQIKELGRESMDRFRWIVAEFPHLSDEERQLFYTRHTALQDALTEAVREFVDDAAEAHKIALTVICTMIGYGMLFWNLGMDDITGFSADDAIRVVSGWTKRQE
jgi:AcrR family transcriptional regulator